MHLIFTAHVAKSAMYRSHIVYIAEDCNGQSAKLPSQIPPYRDPLLLGQWGPHRAVHRTALDRGNM